MLDSSVLNQGVDHLDTTARDQRDPTNDVLAVRLLALLAPVPFDQGLQITPQGICLLDPVDEHVLPDCDLALAVRTHHLELGWEVRTNILQSFMLIHTIPPFLYDVYYLLTNYLLLIYDNIFSKESQQVFYISF